MNRLLLFILLVTGFAQAQVVNIPDANFKAKLLAASPLYQIAYANGASVKIDTNNDYEIQVSEALAIDSLNVENANISDLTGIGSFANLRGLDCGNNVITSLDVSALTSLKALHCFFNQLTSLDISQLTEIEDLDFSGNQISNIDFSNASNLKRLGCQENALTSFDFTGLTAIESINCSENNLGTLDVSMLGTLKVLACNGCQLTSLNVAGLSGLQWLTCGLNLLNSINTTGLVNLNYFACPANALAELDLTGLSGLIELNCAYNQLTTLNVSAIPNLDSLFCSDNLITDIDFSASSGMRQLDLGHNLFTNIDLSNNPLLLGVVFGYNPMLSTINIKNGTLQGNDFWQDTALTFICADEDEVQATQTVLSNAEIPGVVVNSYCSFRPGGVYNTISGTVRLDADSNGCTSSDIGLPLVKVAINDGAIQGASFTEADGTYAFFVQEPNLTLLPSMENPEYFTISPATTTVTFADNDYHTETRDFCITPNGIHPDAEVVILPTLPARPGFDAHYTIIYKNKGNQILSGILNFNFDDAVVDFVSASVNPDIQITDNVDWNYTNLLPFETRTIEVVLNVNSPMEIPAVNIDDVLNLTATVNPVSGDETPQDNTFGLKQTVVGSFDPNDKYCLEGDTLTPDRIGQYLHYIINFENTGTFPAENVVIKDMIDPNQFDISTLQVFGASHSSETNITGNKAEFIFQNINLAPNEYGYMAFKIKTKSTLQSGDSAINRANIYFDFNFPVETNEASTTFQSLTVEEHVMEKIRVYPNPATRLVDIRTVAEMKSIAVFDIEGRIVESLQVSGKDVTLDIGRYAKGIYFLKIITDKGMKTEKVIKQ
jgi:hypothetical protein